VTGEEKGITHRGQNPEPAWTIGSLKGRKGKKSSASVPRNGVAPKKPRTEKKNSRGKKTPSTANPKIWKALVTSKQG